MLLRQLRLATSLCSGHGLPQRRSGSSTAGGAPYDESVVLRGGVRGTVKPKPTARVGGPGPQVDSDSTTIDDLFLNYF